MNAYKLDQTKVYLRGSFNEVNVQVRLAQRFERFWGARGDQHLCVTKAMQKELRRGWRIPATVFYDRPPSFFRPASVAEEHDLLMRLQADINTPV